MAGNPRVVAPEGGHADMTFMWDGQPQRLRRGTVIDVPAGSPLEEAIGTRNLAPLAASAGQGAEPVSVAAAEAEEAPREDETPQEEAETPAQARGKKNGAAKTADTGTADGSSGEEDGK